MVLVDVLEEESTGLEDLEVRAAGSNGPDVSTLTYTAVDVPASGCGTSGDGDRASDETSAMRRASETDQSRHQNSSSMHAQGAESQTAQTEENSPQSQQERLYEDEPPPYPGPPSPSTACVLPLWSYTQLPSYDTAVCQSQSSPTNTTRNSTAGIQTERGDVRTQRPVFLVQTSTGRVIPLIPGQVEYDEETLRTALARQTSLAPPQAHQASHTGTHQVLLDSCMPVTNLIFTASELNRQAKVVTRVAFPDDPRCANVWDTHGTSISHVGLVTVELFLMFQPHVVVRPACPESPARDHLGLSTTLMVCCAFQLNLLALLCVALALACSRKVHSHINHICGHAPSQSLNLQHPEQIYMCCIRLAWV